MSDFLSNLVARTIAQPALRPRTRSRFEAQTQAGDEAPLVWPEVGPSSEARGTEQAAPAVRAATEVREIGAAAYEARALPSGGTPLGQPAGRQRSTTSTTRTTESGAPAAEGEGREVETRGEGGRPAERAEIRERVVRVPVAARAHRYDEQPPRVIERRGPREIEEVERERVIHNTIERTRRVPDARGHGAPGTPAAEPVIQVSIGRIEVRAVPSAPPARSAPRDRTMTIDDYVAKRKAKERR